jgi:small subunit ribosomal protein S6
LTQNVYECLFILDSNRFARDPNAVDSQITEMIERRGGEVLISRRWNEQKLAFPINGHRKGTYWLSYFRIDPTEVVHFERACRLNDHVLRNLTVKVDERLVDTLVAHASGEKVAEEAATEEAATEEAATEEAATEEAATEEAATEEAATEEADDADA